MEGLSRHAIRRLPPDIRPRERLGAQGPQVLSDAELVGVVLGGRDGDLPLRLGQSVLVEFEGLGGLVGASIEEIAGVDGIGKAKAARVVASVEIGRRLAVLPPSARPRIAGPEDVLAVAADMRHLDREHFRALVLNTKHQLMRSIDVSIGSLTTSIVHPRELFRTVIRHNGAALVAVHNHPSGDVTPSTADIELTRRLAKAGELLGIELLDHVILGDGHFLSLKQQHLF